MSTCDWGFTFEAMKVCREPEWGVPVHGDRAMFEYLMMEAVRTGMRTTVRAMPPERKRS